MINVTICVNEIKFVYQGKTFILTSAGVAKDRPYAITVPRSEIVERAVCRNIRECRVTCSPQLIQLNLNNLDNRGAEIA